jgi:hypothetical protein
MLIVFCLVGAMKNKFLRIGGLSYQLGKSYIRRLNEFIIVNFVVTMPCRIDLYKLQLLFQKTKQCDDIDNCK